ncbi:hypothetical protein ACFWGE_21405 [Streptomyces bacillaris]|uniref:hypothetical protein n=1 Tax=Streptomyces bacillaris TaxID=68179 RepID=UPI00365B09D3
MTGYQALFKGGTVTVFGPDGTEIASARRASGYGSAISGRVGETRLVADGLGDGRLTAFAELAARHHRAVNDPGARDRVWVRWESDGIAEVHGTDKEDKDDRRAVKQAGHLLWSGRRQAWVTGRTWNPGTRDRNLAAALQTFARQDRDIVVLGPGQTPDDLPAAPGQTAALPQQQAAPAASSVAEPVPEPDPVPEPEPVDLTGLTDEELLTAEKATIQDRDHRREIGRRALERAAGPPPAELSEEDLGAELEWWERALWRTPYHSSDENQRMLERRKNEVVAERNGRTARALLAGPAAADLDDAALESAYERIGKAWLRLPGGVELNDQVTAYRAALKEERVVRRVRSYGERTPVGEMTLEELTAESTDLRSHAKTHAEQSEFSYREEIKQAQEERLKAVEEAWHQRGLEQHPDAARARLGAGSGGRQPVRIDGARDTYGYVERQGKKFRALADYSERSSLGDFDSAPAAMAALVRRFDQDPETLPQRTWGLRQNVDLVSSSYEPLVSWLRRRPSLSREQDRLLTELTPYEMPTQTKVLHPLTNKVARAYPFWFEEGLLGELARVAERATEDLREQSLNEELPKREREAAKRRIPAMGAALIRINAVIGHVREAGGDVERRGVDQGRVAAQLSALAGSVDGGEGGEGDGGEQPVRDAAAEALGGVPAQGAGGDGGPGEVLPDAGVADGRGDRHGGGGPGGGAGTGDGVPGPGRSAAADPGDGAGAGPARDAAAAGGRPGPGGTAESGSGGAGVDPQGAGEPGAVVRFRPDPADLPRGPMARAEANLAALKVLRTVEGEKRGATLEEKWTLARWSGWGSVPTVFLDEPDADEPLYQPGGDREGGFETDHAQWESYSRVRGELRDLLDPFEWRAASRAVLSAHYTPQAVAEAMWEGLAAYGFEGGEVLEAGCGSGAFFGVAPKGARLTGVELDTTTAAIAARIYPHANVLPESFTDTDAPLGTFDAVIGNVPFAQAPFGERRYQAGGHSLHNGFIIKQLALLRPGAYMSVITSRWTLDGEDSSARQDMSRWGDLAAAYRLPKGTFGETADTDVVADVLVFRRRAEGEEPGDLGWIDAPERELGGHTVGVNAYFTQHPDHVLGRLTAESGPYGPRVTVQGDPGQAPRLLRERMQTTAAAAVAAGRDYVPHEDWPHREPLLLQTARAKHATDFTGRLYTDDQGRIWQHVNGSDPVRVIAADGVAGTEQLRMLLSLRDVAGELQELDRTADDPARAQEVRGQLSRLHAVYTEKYGPLSRPRQTRLALPSDEAKAAARKAEVGLDGEDRLPTGWGWFRQDPHAAVVLGLEHWDRATERAVPSEVLVRRPGTLRGELKPTSDPKTALMAVMGATGRVDLPMIANLLGTTTDDARLRLGTEVFDNPVTGKLEHAGAYLSGAVRTKLEQARTAAATDPAYAVNVAALEVAQPAQKVLGQFTAKLGAHWIPAPLVQGFLREYLGDPTLQVSHNERYGWSLAAGKVPDAVNALKGTARRPALHIAKALLGRASMAVNLLDGSGVDEDATRAMRYKADAMRSAFEEYCTASTIRVTQLTDAYNRQMNGHVVRSYDGLSPTLEGFTTERTPHPWQHSGAARMQFERGVILAHEMGLGKTTTMVMGSQALKASGQIAKPFVVVQPGLGKQWLDEAELLYPNADIRLITSDDLADGNRRPVLEWLRANTPDLVIFTEGAFGSIRMSPERQELFIFRELESLKEQLERERDIPHNAFALMKLEQRLATVEARIRRNDAPMRTPGEVYWDDLGFDYVMVDEAHRFTALGFRSKEAGGSSASIRAVDLYQKVDWHHQVAEADGGRPTVTLGTGTPMENSIAEQYDCLELATPWLLDQFGVHGPDLWAETYGEKVQRIEMAPDGSGLTIVERFSRFTSKQTMKTMWGLATDTKTGDEVGIERPQIAGGAPKLVLVDPTADQQARLQRLVVRGQAIHAGDVTRDEDNMLAVSGEGRAVALDPRLVDASAPAGNKLVQAADIIAAGYHANKDRTYAGHPDPGGLFFVFANSGTPGGNNKGNFDAYAELRELLATRGVPREMVQFAQEHRSPEQKAAMTKAANNGGIAVLMGSSEVLGTGFNGQTRAYALMHLDQDWTPAMMMQRNARALRPGNQHKEVDIYFLATKGSMDAWQVGLLTSKAEGLRDIQRPPGEGDDDGDSVEEIGASDWDYATMAAEIGGNPYMRDFMEAKLHLQGLESDRRNAAADRVRQTELLGIKEGELSATRSAITARENALPKITDTIRGDDFRIRIGGVDYDRFGEAAPALRRAVTDTVRAYQNMGYGPWKVLGTFGGLSFAVRPEIAINGDVSASIGFPELRHSESRCSMEDLLRTNIGSTMLGRLATALEKAEDHQLMDHERLPGLEREVAVLTAQREAVNYGPAIEHARRRVELLDGIVGAITERDKVPELTESMLDPKRYNTERSRKKAVREQAEKRGPLQAAVDAAAAELTAFDENNPAPEPVQLDDEWTEDNDTPEAFEQWRQTQKIIIQQNREAGLGVPAPAEASALTPVDGTTKATDSGPATPSEQSTDRAEAPGAEAQEPATGTAEPTGGVEAAPAPAAEPSDVEVVTPQQPAHTGSGPTVEQSPASAGPERTPATSLPAPESTTDGGTAHDAADDGYGTADFFQDHGIPLPPRVAPKPAPEPEEEPEEGTGVSDNQLTVEDVQPEPDPAEQEAARSTGSGRVQLVSDDGKLTFTLLEVPADSGLAEAAVEGYQRTHREFSAVVNEKNTQAAMSPAERDDLLARWRRTYKGENRLEPFRPLPALKLTKGQDAPGLAPDEYGIGSWLAWRDGSNGQQVTGQVTGPGPAGNTWFVSTDRSGHTGEFHVLSRSGKKSTGYTYSLNGRATDLRPADGPGPQQPLEDLPEVDAVPAPPITSYADWIPADGLARVREPIPVTVGEAGPRLGPEGQEEVAFDVVADGISFVVRVGRNNKAGIPVYLPRIDAGDKAITFPWADTPGAAVYFCVEVARGAKEMAVEPLEAKFRKRDLTLADDGVCERCSQFRDDDAVKELYRVDGGDADCIDHVSSRFEVPKTDVARLGQARRIWATRTVPEPEAADPVPSAGGEQPDQAQAEAETAPYAGPPTGDPREVARQTLQGGNRITIVVSGRSVEWNGEAWGLPVPETVTVTGTVYPGHRDYHQHTRLLDAVIREETGRYVAAPDSVHIRWLPEHVQLIPAEHRDDLRPEPRTVRKIRLGDLIAEGGARGEAVTELHLTDRNRLGNTMAFTTRDVATDTPNSFGLSFTDEVLVVPRERRAPQDVDAVFGRHSNHHEVESATRRTHELHAAVTKAIADAGPDSTGPLDYITALDTAVAQVAVAAPTAVAYRECAAATETAAIAAEVLFDAADDDFLTHYIGKPLDQLRQHLDMQVHQLRATAAYLTERAVPAPTANPGTADEPAPPVHDEHGTKDRPSEPTGEREDAAPKSTGETEQLGLFGDPPPVRPETGGSRGAVPTDEPRVESVVSEDGREARLRAALVEGESIAAVSFTDEREPVAGWILTTAAGHTFRIRPVTYSSSGDDEWEAGHDADGSYWWAMNVEDRPLAAVLARIREDSATRTRFAALWAQYGHLTEQAPRFETTTNRVELEEGVYLVSRFGRIGLIASCRWGWEHLTDPDGAQGHTEEGWSRRGPDNRQYVAEWQIWHLAQEAVPNERLRVVALLTDDMAETPDAYCDASYPYVGKCSAKRSGARYTVAVDTDQSSEIGCYTVCARCLSHRLLSDTDRQIDHHDVQRLVRALAKGDPKVGNLHWKQWDDRAAEIAGQMLSAALVAGEAAPWPAQDLASQILSEACEAGDDRAMREARAAVKAGGGNAKAQKQAAEEAFAARQDRAALVAGRGEISRGTTGEADREDAHDAAAILELAGWGTEKNSVVPERAGSTASEVAVDVDTLTVSPRVLNGEPSSYQFTVTGPGLTVGEYHISHDAQGRGARGIMWQAWWHGVEPSGRWDVISIGSGEGESAALATVAEHAASAGGDVAAGFGAARRMHYDAGMWLLPEVGESEAIQYHPDGSWTITAETGAPYTVRSEWEGRTASGDLAPLLIEDQAGTLIASCTAVDSYMSAWAPMLDRLRLHATAVADGVQHATAVTLGGPTQEWVEAWCVCSWSERADVAGYADRAPAGEAMTLAHHQEMSAAAEEPAAAELPELDVVLLDVDVPPLDPAEPYDTDEEAQADIGRLGEAFARWDALPTVQRYYEADRQQRSDGAGAPTNPVAQLAAAYRDAEQSLLDGPAGSPDDLVRQVHTVAVWSDALEPVVDEVLLGPLREVRAVATLLASRSQATVEAFEAELAALSEDPAEETVADTAPAEQALVAVDDEPEAPEDTTEPGPGEPVADTGPAEPPAAAQNTTAPEMDGVTDDEPQPKPEEAPAPPAAADTPESTAADSDPEPDRAPVTQEPAAAVPDEGMHEARREASFLEQDRTQPTDGNQQTPEPGTAAVLPQPDPAPDPIQASEAAAPGDETARDASEEPTMTTPQTDASAPDEQITEEPPAPQRYVDTVTLAGDPGYWMRLSGLDGQPVDSGDVLRGDLVIATLHPGPEGGWFARLAAERLPDDVTYLVDAPQDAAAQAAVMHSAFTGAPYGPAPGAAVGDETRQRVDVLRADLRDASVRHGDAVTGAATRAYPDIRQNEHFQALVDHLDGLAAAVSDAYGSQQMTQHLNGVQEAVNAWGGALPNNPGHPERRQLAFPLAHLLYDARRMQDQVQATLAAMQAEREAAQAEEAAAAVALNESYLADYQAGRPPRDEAAAAAYREWQQLDAQDQQEALDARGEEDERRSADTDEKTAASTDAGPRQEGKGYRSPEVPDSQTTDTAHDASPAAPAGATADTPPPGDAEGAATPEDGGPATDAAVDAVRRALEDALQATEQPEPAAPQPGELPLWTGPEASPTDTTAPKPAADPIDVHAEFQAVLDAWDEHVPSVNGTAQDLVAELDANLVALQRAFTEAVTPPAPAEPATPVAPAASTTEREAAAPVLQQASDVNTALQQADTHGAALQDLPEWQKLQTVRGAVGHLFRVMRERAGEHFERLMEDNRVGEFFRKVSINACEKVAGWAQAGADRLRRRGEEKGTDAAAADALRDVADAASAYSSIGGGRGGTPPAARRTAPTTVDIPEMRQFGAALSRPLPGARDGRGTRVSTAAARGKSPTRGAAKKPGDSGTKKAGGSPEQAGHLRRGGTEPQQQNPKPSQR